MFFRQFSGNFQAKIYVHFDLGPIHCKEPRIIEIHTHLYAVPWYLPPIDVGADDIHYATVLLRHRLLAEAPRRYQQGEEKEGFEWGLCFHGGMVVESLNCLFVELFGRDEGVKS